jgi:hypothetical protein
MITKYSQTQYDIFDEISTALINLGATSGLITCISSLGDTMSDEDVLQMLKDWNAKKYGAKA